MLHPLIIGIVTANTSLTVFYWIFILGDAYFRWLDEPEDKPQKVVTAAWGRHSQYGLTEWLCVIPFCLDLVRNSGSSCSAFCWVCFCIQSAFCIAWRRFGNPFWLTYLFFYLTELILQVNEEGVILTGNAICVIYLKQENVFNFLFLIFFIFIICFVFL